MQFGNASAFLCITKSGAMPSLPVRADVDKFLETYLTSWLFRRSIKKNQRYDKNHLKLFNLNTPYRLRSIPDLLDFDLLDLNVVFYRICVFLVAVL